MDEATTILFEDYLEGLLSEENRLAFEKRLEEDAEFAANFNTYKALSDHLSHQFSKERSDFKTQLENIGSTFFEENTSKKQTPKVIRLKPWHYSIAASIALLIGFFVIQNMGSLDPEDYIFSESIEITERSQDATTLKDAETAFNNGAYKDAIENFDILLETDPENVELLFYKAIAHDAILEYDKADAIYNRLKNGSSLYKHKAAFYAGVSQWKRNNALEAQKLLETIPSSADEYKDAQRILKKL